MHDRQLHNISNPIQQCMQRGKHQCRIGSGNKEYKTDSQTHQFHPQMCKAYSVIAASTSERISKHH
eukprot:scaffold7094_cov108-Skeletonema_dohrnii-CCMP3373.AAC.2